MTFLVLIYTILIAYFIFEGINEAIFISIYFTDWNAEEEAIYHYYRLLESISLFMVFFLANMGIIWLLGTPLTFSNLTVYLLLPIAWWINGVCIYEFAFRYVAYGSMLEDKTGYYHIDIFNKTYKIKHPKIVFWVLAWIISLLSCIVILYG